MKVTVKNPTARAKAVRVKSGHEVIKPGGSATVDCSWTEDEKQRYASAGLKVSEAKTDAKAPKEPKAPKAPKAPKVPATPPAVPPAAK